MEPDGFIRNGWYALAWSEELGPVITERWVCGVPLVVFRDADGRAVALDGTCPHRRYPLALGRLDDGVVTCGYHGLRFNAAGECVRAPGSEHVPAKLRVTSYPLVERGGLIWIWPGEADRADASTIVDTWLTDPAWVAVHDTKIVDARQSLLIDNLMDLTHESSLHTTTLGHAAVTETPLVTEVLPASVRASRLMLDVPPPGLFSLMGLTGKIDRGQIAEFHPPGLCLTIVTATPRNAAHRPLRWTVMHCLTPETSGRTRYLWATARDYALDDQSVSDTWLTTTNQIFEQDVAALNAQEQRIRALPERTELSLAADAGALAARKMMRELLKCDQTVPARSPVSPSAG
jgi:phenylpropionate dioxygenase-like ring-hydroxylating dioxygenase large terminal subunit